MDVMDATYSIYLVKSPSNRYYVGMTSQSLDIRRKWHHQESDNKKSRHYQDSFKRALRKYGNKLVWTIILSNLTKEEAIEKETHYIKYYNSFFKGYNMTIGGEGRSSYSKEYVLDESQKYMTIQEWSRASKGTYDFAQRQGGDFFLKCKEHMIRKQRPTFSEEDLIKKGSIYSTFKEWRKEDRSSYSIAKKFGIEFLQKIIPNDILKEKFFVYKNDVLIGEWSSIRKCAKDLNCCAHAISRVLSGEYRQTKEYIMKWR